MADDDKLSFLEQLSNVLIGQYPTAGAKAVYRGAGKAFSGAPLSDVPDAMREAIQQHLAASNAPKPKSERDALELASALAAMSNPVSLAGHAVDFAAAVPKMLEYKLSDVEPPTGMIAETGLKRRLAKGGAQADYAKANQLERARSLLQQYGRAQPGTELFPLESTKGTWGLGEGKFQTVGNYESKAFDLGQMRKKGMMSMGSGSSPRVAQGTAHDLGIEFTSTPGLHPEYLGKGYGKQIYQNMADVYGGGISHAGSTSEAARRVYDALGAIDTGIPSGGGTRQALPTRAMKENPEALAAFEQKVKEYAGTTSSGRAAQKDYWKEVDALEALPANQSEFIARELLRNQIDNNQVNQEQISKLINQRHRIYIEGAQLPDVIQLGRYKARRIPDSDMFEIQQ